jgi:hypothetical protein
MVRSLQEALLRTLYLVTGDLCSAIGNAIPQLISRLDDSATFVRQAVINAMAELVKNSA